MIDYVIKDLFDLSEEEYRSSFYSMSAERRNKVERFKDVEAKKSTLAGEWITRNLLAKHTGESPNTFIISATKQGKLYTEKNYGYHFNISHSGTKVAVAVSDKEIGVDIEIIRPLPMRLCKRVCTEDELFYIFGSEPFCTVPEKPVSEDILKRFLEIWTIKEAIFKCEGTGITDFKSVSAFSDDYLKTKIENDEYIVHMIVKK